MEEINSIPDDGNTVTGLPSGFSELDKTTDFHDDELIILAARPGVGKTAFALNARNCWFKTDKLLLCFH